MIKDEGIEAVSRMLCTVYGLDPEELVTHGQLATSRIKDKMLATYVYDVAFKSPRWKLFAQDAEKLIAFYLIFKVLDESTME
jgi:hypothetical protein